MSICRPSYERGRARAHSGTKSPGPTSRWTLMICASALIALTSCDPKSESPSITPPATTRPFESADPLSVTLVKAEAGMFKVDLGRPVRASVDGAWMEHSVTFTNQGTVTAYLADTREARILGSSAKPLIVGGDGCAYGVHPTTQAIIPLCNTDLRAYVLDPGKSQTITLRLWRNLPGSAQSEGEYRFQQPLAFTDNAALFRRPPTDPGLTMGIVALKYEVAR